MDFLVLLEVVVAVRRFEDAAGEDFRCVAVLTAGAVPGWPIGHVAFGEV